VVARLILAGEEGLCGPGPIRTRGGDTSPRRSMIVVDWSPYTTPINHDHGRAVFGGADKRVAITFVWP
jgi:hypothetical protein